MLQNNNYKVNWESSCCGGYSLRVLSCYLFVVVAPLFFCLFFKKKKYENKRRTTNKWERGGGTILNKNPGPVREMFPLFLRQVFPVSALRSKSFSEWLQSKLTVILGFVFVFFFRLFRNLNRKLCFTSRKMFRFVRDGHLFFVCCGHFWKIRPTRNVKFHCFQWRSLQLLHWKSSSRFRSHQRLAKRSFINSFC